MGMVRSASITTDTTTTADLSRVVHKLKTSISSYNYMIVPMHDPK